VRWRVRRSRIGGSLSVPGDKSIAHRALMLAALARGSSFIEQLPRAEDVRSTMEAVRALGVEIELQDGTARVTSAGQLTQARGPIYAGNSGTTMRLLAGILAGRPFQSRICGDASLTRRPMKRVVDPLQRMGAIVDSHEGHPPLDIRGGRLHGIEYTLPLPSAQVKSCVLLAGLFADGPTSVVEPTPTRDHTERMFRAVGIRLALDGQKIVLRGDQRPSAFEMRIPGDVSSASFFLAGAALTGGDVTIHGVGVNPTRSGFLVALQRMGTSVDLVNLREEMGEPIADIRITGGIHRPIEVCGSEIPLLVDELPLLALLGTQASGRTVVRDAAELRVKESDRIAAVARTLRLLGADVEELPDGFVVSGPTALRGGVVDGCGDHRIAMMLVLAGMIAKGETIIEGAEASAVSLPDFATLLAHLGGQIERA